MPSSADDRFCVWLLMTLLAACSRLMPAPMAPRKRSHLRDRVVDVGQRGLGSACRLQVVIGDADAVHVAAVELCPE